VAVGLTRNPWRVGSPGHSAGASYARFKPSGAGVATHQLLASEGEQLRGRRHRRPCIRCIAIQSAAVVKATVGGNMRGASMDAVRRSVLPQPLPLSCRSAVCGGVAGTSAPPGRFTSIERRRARSAAASLKWQSSVNVRVSVRRRHSGPLPHGGAVVAAIGRGIDEERGGTHTDGDDELRTPDARHDHDQGDSALYVHPPPYGTEEVTQMKQSCWRCLQPPCGEALCIRSRIGFACKAIAWSSRGGANTSISSQLLAPAPVCRREEPMEERPSRRKARARVRGVLLSPLAAEARRRDGGGGGAREAGSEQAQGAERGEKPQQAHGEHGTEYGSERREQPWGAADAEEWRATALAVVRMSAATVIVGALCVLAAPMSLRAAETHVRSSRQPTSATTASSTASLTGATHTATPALASSTTAVNAAATLAASDFRYNDETWGDAAVGFFFYQCAPCALIRLPPACGPNA
jgi:hypothetical protein